MKQPSFIYKKCFRLENFVNLHIMIEHLKINCKLGTSFPKLSRKSGVKWKKGTSNLNAHQIFEEKKKKIHTVKLVIVYNLNWTLKVYYQTTGLFISFLAKNPPKISELKIAKMKNVHFQGPLSSTRTCLVP